MVNIAEIKAYIDRYEKVESIELKNEGVEAFLNSYVEWQGASGFIYGIERGWQIYGEAFVVFTTCLYDSTLLNEALAEIVSKEIRAYEARVEYAFGVMYSLYLSDIGKWKSLDSWKSDYRVEEKCS